MVLYEEIQQFPKWRWYFVIILALLFWAFALVQLVLDIDIGNNPVSDYELTVLTAIFGVLFPIFFIIMKGRVQVTNLGVRVRVFPIYRKFFKFSDILKVERTSIKPIQEFGGWGLRYNGKKWALLLDGQEGIELHFAKRRPFVIGTKNADQLLSVLEKNLNKKG